MNLDTGKNGNIKIGRKSLFAKIFEHRPVKSNEIPAAFNAIDDYELLEGIKNARNEWIDANMNFNYVDDQEIIDYYTYKILASQVRYEYFLKKAKEKGIRVGLIEG